MEIKYLNRRLFVVFATFLPFLIFAQQGNVITARDGFLSIATDARAAGQGDIGVATSADSYSQLHNPSKYLFSDKKAGIAVTQVLGTGDIYNQFSQVNLLFHNRPNDRNAYALSFRNYTFGINDFVNSGTNYRTHEVAVDGSYTLKLSDVFALSVGGRFISLKGKAPIFDGFLGESAFNLYGIDVSGYYNGNEKAYNKFNGRFRAGFTLHNLRGKSSEDNKFIEIYAPTLLKSGVGFDFIFDQDNVLGITTEYKMLLEDYTRNIEGEPLVFGLEGSVMALGLEYVLRDKLAFRTGYSKGIKRMTDSFGSLGAGLRTRYVEVDAAFLFGLSNQENPIREKLRLSLSLDLMEVLF